jgi:CDP-paratose synthetase
MNVVILGASGFFGSVVARRLVECGHTVSLLLRPTSSLARLAAVADNCRIGRCSTPADVRGFLRDADPDAILYSVCLYGGPQTSVADMIAANLEHGVISLEACLSICAERRRTFVNSGTSLPETLNAYSSMKASFAKLGRMMSEDSHSALQFIDMRLESLYGWERHPTRFTSTVIHACCRNAPSLPLTAGQQQRDFLHVADAAAACETVLAQSQSFADQDTISIGSGRSRSIREFVETTRSLSRSTTRLGFGELPYRPREAMRCIGDPSRLELLGWRQQAPFEHSLALTIQQVLAS